MQFQVSALLHMELATIVLDASDESDARLIAENQGYAVLAIRARKREGWSWSGGSRFPLIQFNQSLLTLMQAGLSLVEGIEALAERETRPVVKGTLASLLRKLYEGQSFSAALAIQPSAFPPLYVATIRANEKTGALNEAIDRFIRYRSQIELVKKRVVSAAIYPLLILIVGGLVILFLLLYVVPRFSQVFDDLGDRIPYLSKILLKWGEVVHANGWLVMGIALSTPLLISYIVTRPMIRASIGRFAIRIPRLGEYVRVYQLARFYRTVGMLLRGGMPILGSLDMATGLLPSSLQSSLLHARNDIREGQPISSAFDANGLSTPVSLRMLRVGERSGQMGEMMERIAAFFEDDVSIAIDWFIRLFEPFLMILIGVIIGVIVLLMYAPIFELAGSIQ